MCKALCIPGTVLLSAYAMPSDIVDWVKWLGFGSYIAAFALLLYVLLLRGWLWLQDRNRQRAWNEWQPLCMNAICGLPNDQPLVPVTHRNWLFFFQLWHHYLLNVKGDALSNLQQLGLQMKLHHITIKKLDPVMGDYELIAAIISSGFLHDARAWNPLLRFLRSNNSIHSFAAARALARIDSQAALPEIIPLIGIRPTWNRNQVAALLLEVGPEQVSDPLLQAIFRAPENQVVALMRFLKFADIDTCDTVLQRYLGTSQNPELLCVCLKAARSEKVLPLVRAQLTNESWFVRVEAANVLGYLGVSDDIDSLSQLLADPHWWVRYRAARAIGELLHHDTSELERIRLQQTDRYAADILAQVVAEWKKV